MPEAGPSGVVLYLHGGGFVMGSARAYRALTSRLAFSSGCEVVAIDYRLAPEFPFPVALDDAVKAYDALVDAPGVLPIVVAGDSAGGNLALSLLLHLRDAGRPMPKFGVALSPVVDLTLSGDAVAARADRDPFVSVGSYIRCALDYSGTSPRSHPLISPALAELAGLPPILLHVGTEEILHDQVIAFAESGKNAGVDIDLEVWDGMVHVWHLFAPILPKGQAGISRVGQAIRDHLVRTIG